MVVWLIKARMVLEHWNLIGVDVGLMPRMAGAKML